MIKKKFLYIIAAIILCTVIIIPVFFISGGNEDAISTDNKESSTKTSQTQFKEIDFTLYNGQKTVRWELAARKLSHYKEDDYLKLSPVEICVYDNNKDEILYSFTAEKGSYQGNEGKLIIDGPIDVNCNNYQLKIGNLSWQQDKDIIKGSSGVEVITPAGNALSGKYLITDSRLYSISVYGSDEKQACFSWKERKNDKN